jgi:hypothetical protein
VAAFFLVVFPVGWIALSLYHHGSVANLSITSEQYVNAHGRDYGRALRYNMLTYFAYDLLTNPMLILGVLGLVGFAVGSRRSLIWTVIWFLPLPILAIAGIASLALPDAARWRMSGAWTLLWLPFAASGLVTVVERVAPASRRIAVLGALVAVAALAFLPRDASLIRKHLDPASVHAGGFVQALVGGGGGKVLIDAVDNLAYLDVLIASNTPKSFVTTALADPVEIALYLPGSAAYHRESRDDVIDTYLRDHFSLATSPDVKKMRAHGIRYLLVLHRKSIARLRASRSFEEMRRFGDWTLFAVR